MRLDRLLAWALLGLACSICFATAADSEEPANPTCRAFAKNDLAFCSMVDYHAVVDADDPYGAAFDAKARAYYENVNIVLHRFGCNSNTHYSLYTCDHCRDAYKYWICSIKFQRCGLDTRNDGATFMHTLCPYSLSAGGFTSSDCKEGMTGRYRTCLSLCEDVVRKCPYVVGFQCPTTETTYFSTNITTCNKLDREKNPDKDAPWPGTFADA